MAKISVYIPTKNRTNLVLRAATSVLNQTLKDIELIVVIDGRDPVTYDALMKLSLTDSRLKVICYEKSNGACFARNSAIDIAKGEFVTGLDDDDYFLPEHLECNLNFLEKSGLDIVFSGQNIWNGKYFKSENVFNSNDIVDNELIMQGNVIGNQIFCRKKCFIDAGLFDLNLPALQDYELWIRMIQCYGVAKFSGFITYVVDVSHQHERITKSPDKISFSVNYVFLKHRDFFKNKEYFLYSTKLRYKGVFLTASELNYFLSFSGLLVLLRAFYSRIKKNLL